MSENRISEMVEAAILKIKEMATTETVVGDPISMPGGATAIPICKVTFGFGSGGADIPSKSSEALFGGGIGSGVSITPIAFLVERGSKVELMQLNTIGTTADRLVGSVPEVMDKVSDIVANFKSK